MTRGVAAHPLLSLRGFTLCSHVGRQKFPARCGARGRWEPFFVSRIMIAAEVREVGGGPSRKSNPVLAGDPAVSITMIAREIE
jgi:hypothetical protein